MNKILAHQNVLSKAVKSLYNINFKTSVNMTSFKKKNVREMAHIDKYKKKLTVVPVSDTAQVFVLSTGSYGTGRSVLLKTNYDRYLFNCGEGTQKVITDVVSKVGPVDNIFFTYNTWNNIGGLMGFLMSNSAEIDHVDTIRLHGPPNIDKLLKMITPFSENSENVVASIDVRGIDNVKYEDEQLTVEYVELVSSESSQGTEQSTDDIKKAVMCYIVRLKELPRKIDSKKLAALKTPSGPWIKQLINGEEVTLPDGRIIKPNDVLLEKGSNLGPILVLDCPTEDYVDPLITNKQLLDLQTDDVKPVLMIHMAPAALIAGPRYEAFMGRFQSGTIHLMINENSPSPYVHRSQMFQSILNRLHPGIFPSLQGHYHYNTRPTPTTDNVVQAYYGLAYKVRPVNQQGFNWDDLVYFDHAASFEEMKEKAEPVDSEIDEELSKLKSEIQQREVSSDGKQPENEYPEIVFLGTGSAKPSLMRNASAILVQLRKDEYFIMDCGEGALLQMYQMYGLEKTNHILCNLKGLFISHLHYDHHGGVFGILEARQKVLSQYGRNDRLTIFAPSSLKRWYFLYSRYVSPIENTIELITNETIYNDIKDGKESDQISYTKNLLNVSKFVVMPVVHISHSFGISIKHIDGWKLVYSGDCMPSQELISYGKDCDILIHEGTFDDEAEVDARRKRHCTTGQAIEVGKKMNAKYTLLTHFSQRFPKIPEFSDKFTENVGFSFDFMQVRPSQLRLIHMFKATLDKMFGHSLKTRLKKGIKASNPETSKSSESSKFVETKSLVEDLYSIETENVNKNTKKDKRPVDINTEDNDNKDLKEDVESGKERSTKRKVESQNDAHKAMKTDSGVHVISTVEK
ncbi:zinc phosphodiesterase ELAC protein 2-like [Ruditapes philippinarum]|uniref:zinc phosphodiesterase ELAC protein 2-like n=1 Tax=Ruditapes philippinarum TaxID=129788 RepID=UPI00295B30EB|nr:zinc phosphodiesterase ELAC protein 2-like [Ruditapes philippinarum]